LHPSVLARHSRNTAKLSVANSSACCLKFFHRSSNGFLLGGKIKTPQILRNHESEPEEKLRAHQHGMFFIGFCYDFPFFVNLQRPCFINDQEEPVFKPNPFDTWVFTLIHHIWNPLILILAKSWFSEAIDCYFNRVANPNQIKGP